MINSTMISRTAILQPLPGIGDMVWFLSIIRSIAAVTEEKSLTLISKMTPSALDMFIGEGTVGEYLQMPRHSGLRASIDKFMWLIPALRRSKVQRLYFLHNSKNYAMVAALAGVKERIGFDFEHRRNPWLTQSVTLPREMEKAFPLKRGKELLRGLGIPLVEDVPRINVDPVSLGEVRKRFGHLPRPWVVIATGSSDRNRIWPCAKFAELSDAIASKAGSIIYIGGPADREGAQQTVAFAKVAAPHIVTDLPMRQTIALLSEADLFIGNDTGPANISASVGVRSVILFGANVPFDYSPNIIPVIPYDGVHSQDGVNRISVDVVVAKVLTLL